MEKRKFTYEEVLHHIKNLYLSCDNSDGAILNYNTVFVQRYVNTLNSLRNLPNDLNVLELAASPYGMTAILRHEMFNSLSLAGFGALDAPPRPIIIGLGKKRYELYEKFFNAEKDKWPYEDETFDLIICCEMMEHLAMDPMHVFSEANRILKPHGKFLVSTPNASSFQNIIKILAFNTPSLAPHYRLPSTFENIYSRHNRELTPLALAAMFKAAGFAVVLEETVNSYPYNSCGIKNHIAEQVKEIMGPLEMRNDTLNYIGTKILPVRERFPVCHELYLASDLK